MSARAVLLAALAIPLSAGCFSTKLGDFEKYMVFATGTTFGLDFTQRADQTVDIAMGYDRAEIASIPTAMEGGAATPTEDVYSVMGTFCARYSTPWAKDNDFRLRQLFATGEAAVKASKNAKMRKYFQDIMTGDTKLCDPDEKKNGGGS